jgi:hypothetical protein
MPLQVSFLMHPVLWPRTTSKSDAWRANEIWKNAKRFSGANTIDVISFF